MNECEDGYPGILKARSVLASLSTKPSKSSRYARTGSHKYIRELYPEIRAARLAGHSYKEIVKRLWEIPEIPKFTASHLATVFKEVDAEWARETGEPAIPVERHVVRRKSETA